MCQLPSITNLSLFPLKHIISLGVLTTGGKMIDNSNDDVSFVATQLLWASESDAFFYLKFMFRMIITQRKHENKWKVLLLKIMQNFALLEPEHLFLSNRISFVFLIFFI